MRKVKRGKGIVLETFSLAYIEHNTTVALSSILTFNTLSLYADSAAEPWGRL